MNPSSPAQQWYAARSCQDGATIAAEWTKVSAITTFSSHLRLRRDRCDIRPIDPAVKSVAISRVQAREPQASKEAAATSDLAVKSLRHTLGWSQKFWEHVGRRRRSSSLQIAGRDCRECLSTGTPIPTRRTSSRDSRLAANPIEGVSKGLQPANTSDPSGALPVTAITLPTCPIRRIPIAYSSPSAALLLMALTRTSLMATNKQTHEQRIGGAMRFPAGSRRRDVGILVVTSDNYRSNPCGFAMLDGVKLLSAAGRDLIGPTAPVAVAL
jgi:hypothetical protein